MEISILEEFVTLVDTCSFQETAARMNISQSALTKHIHKLEEELNASLFERSTRTVQPNEYSQTLYPYARQMLELYRDACTSLKKLSEKDQSSFTIAYLPHMGQYGLIETLSEFTRRFPDHTANIIESYQPLSLLQQHKCDFAFVPGKSADDPNFNKLIYKTDYLAAILPSDHPLAGSDHVMLEQLYGERFILHSSSAGTPHQETSKFLELCESKHFLPEIAAKAEFTTSVLRFVRNHQGIAILNRLHVPDIVPDISIVNLYPSVHSYIYFMYQRKLSSSYAKDFLHFIIEKIGEQ